MGKTLLACFILEFIYEIWPQKNCVFSAKMRTTIKQTRGLSQKASSRHNPSLIKGTEPKQMWEGTREVYPNNLNNS
jgi:hypothetical protein